VTDARRLDGAGINDARRLDGARINDARGLDGARINTGAVAWAPAGWLAAAVTVGVLAVPAAAAAGRFDLLVFGAPLVGALAGAWWSTRPGGSVRSRVTTSAQRVFEGEPLLLTAEVTAPPGVELLGAEVDTGEELTTLRCTTTQRPTARVLRGEWELRGARRGRATVWLRTSVRAPGGVLVGEAHQAVAEVAVFPSAERVGAVPRPVDLPDLLGVHLGRRRGEGVEFAGIREYQPGDPMRSINWRVTARRGRLHVTERLVEQAATVVAVIDAAADVHQPGPSTLELSVRGALSVVGAALRRGDRSGVAALGGLVRWLAPDLGRRHYYRVMEALLDVRPGDDPLGYRSLPPAALPRGAAVVVFTPLLDNRVAGAVADLRRRGFGLVVVDVLRTEPTPRPGSDHDTTAVRMWRLGRRAIRHRLAELGVPVVSWATGTELDAALRPVSRRPLSGGRR
jgi:uncharacterized protein (DUF58 family)